MDEKATKFARELVHLEEDLYTSALHAENAKNEHETLVNRLEQVRNKAKTMLDLDQELSEQIKKEEVSLENAKKILKRLENTLKRQKYERESPETDLPKLVEEATKRHTAIMEKYSKLLNPACIDVSSQMTFNAGDQGCKSVYLKLLSIFSKNRDGSISLDSMENELSNLPDNESDGDLDGLISQIREVRESLRILKECRAKMTENEERRHEIN